MYQTCTQVILGKWPRLTPARQKAAAALAYYLRLEGSECTTVLCVCAGATGKICLMQRGDNTFCAKVANCVAGGGIGAIIYGR
jgi:hypothetical protein